MLALSLPANATRGGKSAIFSLLTLIDLLGDSGNMLLKIFRANTFFNMVYPCEATTALRLITWDRVKLLALSFQANVTRGGKSAMFSLLTLIDLLGDSGNMVE